MSADFETALDECLARLASGESADACLNAYPALADELRPLLALAGGLRAAPAPRARPQAVAAGKQQVLAAFVAQPPRQAAAQGIAARLAGMIRIGPQANRRYVLRFALGILLALTFGTTGAVAASSGSLPGDTLYPVKQSVETLRLALSLDSQSRQALENQFDDRRLVEVQALLQLRRQATAEFEDVLQAIGDNGWWTVGPFAVQVDAGTVILGRPKPGARVQVQVSIRGDGTLAALRIREETGHANEPEHHSGMDGLQFGSPLPTSLPVHDLEHAAYPTRTGIHEAEPEHGLEHEAAPVPQDDPAPAVTRENHDSPAAQPDRPPPALPTDHPEPTAAPTARPAHDAEPASEPSHQPAPTAPAQHQLAPTSEPSHRAPAPVAPAPPHRDSGSGDGGHDSDHHH
jgi:hypothetical protein